MAASAGLLRPLTSSSTTTTSSSLCSPSLSRSTTRLPSVRFSPRPLRINRLASVRASDGRGDQVPPPVEPEQKDVPRQKDLGQAPPPPRKVSTSFFDVFSFSGPAPETINGRLAMLGFAAAIAMEAATGDDLLSQITDGSGARWFVLSALIITAASLVPIFKGVTTESKSGALMSARAEIWNGRAAMLGLVALAITEYVKQGPLI